MVQICFGCLGFWRRSPPPPPPPLISDKRSPLPPPTVARRAAPLRLMWSTWYSAAPGHTSDVVASALRTSRVVGTTACEASAGAVMRQDTIAPCRFGSVLHIPRGGRPPAFWPRRTPPGSAAPGGGLWCTPWGILRGQNAFSMPHPRWIWAQVTARGGLHEIKICQHKPPPDRARGGQYEQGVQKSESRAVAAVVPGCSIFGASPSDRRSTLPRLCVSLQGALPKAIEFARNTFGSRNSDKGTKQKYTTTTTRHCGAYITARR